MQSTGPRNARTHSKGCLAIRRVGGEGRTWGAKEEVKRSKKKQTTSDIRYGHTSKD